MKPRKVLLHRKIMEDPGVSKLGVAIKADCTRLRKQLGINTQGLFELSHLYKLVKFSESKDTHLINKSLVSLAKQVQEHLHLPLFKGEVRGSDWSQSLSWEQIIYAASDPYAAIILCPRCKEEAVTAHATAALARRARPTNQSRGRYRDTH
jgi:hypothetical protein